MVWRRWAESARLRLAAQAAVLLRHRLLAAGSWSGRIVVGVKMPPLPLLVATPSPGTAFEHAQLLPKGSAASAAADGIPKLEKFSELKREAAEANRLATRLQAENNRLKAENETLQRENRELTATGMDADSSYARGKSSAQEIKDLKRQLKRTKDQLASASSQLRSSQRTVAELLAKSKADEPSKTDLQQKVPRERAEVHAKRRSVAAPRAHSEPPRRYDESSADEIESESEYSASDSEGESSDHDGYGRGYSGRGYFSSDEELDSSDESEFDRPVSRRTRERHRRRQNPEDAAIEGTLSVARQSLPLKEYDQFRRYTDHRRRIASISSSVDTSAPRQYAHVRHNAKRAQQEKERKEQQRRDNKRMVQRVREMQQQQPISYW